MAEKPKTALNGVRVLDLSRVLAGPSATQILADLGAEVIKVEQPDRGDETRHWGPPFYQTKDGTRSDAAYFMMVNRNKSSICVDFSTADGQRLLHSLLPQCDILVENFRTGHLARFGLDYETVHAINPKLVYCSITGFGHTGPMADRAGYDYLIQAMSGLMSVTGESDGPPTKVGIAISDLVTGLYASTGVLAALHHAKQTGQGQHIDLALLDCQMAIMSNQAANTLATGEEAKRMGTKHPSLAPYQVFETSDAPVVIAVGTNGQFERLCAAIGLDGLHEDARFATGAARVENRQALESLIAPCIGQRPLLCWIEALAAANVPCGPVNTMSEAMNEPQIIERDMIETMHRADIAQPIRVPASPLRLGETPVDVRRAPPQLGADTEAVLRELLNLSEIDIARLRKAKII